MVNYTCFHRLFIVFRRSVPVLPEKRFFMDKLKRVMAMAGVILTAGIWIATFLTAVLGGSKELLTALLVLSVVVPVLIYAILLVARIVSGKPATDEIDQAIRDGRMKDLSSGPDSSSEKSADQKRTPDQRF